MGLAQRIQTIFLGIVSSASSNSLTHVGQTVALIRRSTLSNIGTSLFCFFSLTSTLAASVDGLLDETRVARYLAAPPEPTLTIDLLLDDSGVVASAAAEKLTTLNPRTSRVTLTTCRP